MLPWGARGKSKNGVDSPNTSCLSGYLGFFLVLPLSSVSPRALAVVGPASQMLRAHPLNKLFQLVTEFVAFFCHAHGPSGSGNTCPPVWTLKQIPSWVSIWIFYYHFGSTSRPRSSTCSKACSQSALGRQAPVGVAGAWASYLPS